MLLQLNINNFALIESLTLNFNKGFNVLTGETGAGKSILIDAINYVLGSKFNRDFIRTGEDKAYVEAIFAIETEKTKAILKDFDIEFDDVIVISRESFQSGKSVAKVNGKTLIISQLRSIAQTLLDIHGQHENQNLLDSVNHINYLDSFGGKVIEDLLKDYSNEYKKLYELQQKINELKGNGERENIINYLKYQMEDIDKGKLKDGEEEELTEKFNVLTHAEKISFALNNGYRLLYDTKDDNSSIYDSVGLIIKDMKSIEKHMEKVKNISSVLEEVYFSLEDVINEIRELKDTVVYDESELEIINSRIYALASYKKRYSKSSIKEIIELRKELGAKYDEIINSEEIIEKLENEKFILENKLKEKAQILHNERVKIGEVLREKIWNELKYIGLEKSRFSIEIEIEEDLKSNGFDKVSFLISTNPGEPLKSLERIVSGGELSRIMLALKTVFVDKDEIPTVIFDEIDTGISGRIAQCVGEKMYVISTKHQVFCVTHLPQIASMSDNHYVVSKNVRDDKTYTEVNGLSKKEKQEEIARMIGGAEITKVTIENSIELIDLAENKKNMLKIS